MPVCTQAQDRQAARMDAAFGKEAFFLNLNDFAKLQNEDDGFRYSVGDRYATDINLSKDAEKTETGDGSTIYRIGFQAPGARFMDISFDRFILPEGGDAYLYNPVTRDSRGPYRREEIPDNTDFSTDLLPGDHILFICSIPSSKADSLQISLRCVIAGQKAFFNSGETPSCLINTACEEAAPYHDIVQSVVLIYMDGYLCSGNLINNTAQDGTPYILTAAHCMENISAPHYGSWKFYFNIASNSCASNNDGPTLHDLGLQVMTGCQLVAKGNNSDFLLLKLNRKIPESYNAYYCGWDRRNSPPKRGMAGIHHPKGDYKKISLSSQEPVTDNCAGVGFNRKAFWRFFWTQGMAFQGSSGSGLFESQNKRLIGTLTAINDVDCQASTDRKLSWYGKLSYHWFANNEQDSAQQLRPWLDPLRSGVLYMDGSYLRSSAQPAVTESEQAVRIYPNPASEELSVRLLTDDIRTAEIFSVSGQRIRSVSLQQGENRIPLQEMAEGIYLLRVAGEHQCHFVKFTVIHP